ncbi:MAG: CoA:oxalate CoA-transferase, partial [Chloroflexota bacterium]|nr:CoA:oxalate CoA-transferase [Chloroflexota bacterium]
MTGPLAHVRVIDLSNLLAGQYCARILADLGAEVIKIEAAPTGDTMRDHDAGDQRRRHLFSYANAGKKSLMLDPGSADTFEIVEKLCLGADVVVEDFLPGSGQDWTVEFSDLLEANERLVLCSITPFGRTGPRQGQMATEAMIQALAGTAFMTGPPGGPPYLTANGFPHTMAASHAGIAVIQALLDRERTGKGQSIDIAMLDTVIAMDCENIPFVAAEQGRYTPLALGHAAFADTLALYQAKDGYIVIEVWGQGRGSMWGRLALAMDREDLLQDPRFVGDPERVTHLDELRPIVEQWLRSFPSDDAAMEALVDSKVVSGRVLAPWQTMDLPQVAARSMVRDVASAAGPRIAVTATPYAFSATPIAVGDAPRLGEHNAEILQALHATSGRGDDASVATTGPTPARPARIEPAGRHPRERERITVLDFTSAVAGPYATRILADLGADVIKVERPTDGDVIRSYAPPGIARGPAFAYTSSGKKSLCIDIADPE